VNVRRRFLDPDADPKIVGIRRRGSQLYPLSSLVDDPRRVVLCEGELDALLLNQLEIPALTSTAGTSWKPEWNRYVIGRRVAVLYDAGSVKKAARRAGELRAAGARDAWAASWEREAFAKGEDVTDAVVKHRWSASDVKSFLDDERRRAKGRGR
jgi:hypothetical protein